MKNDKYRESRGGWSRILDITCEKCENHICFYQKDGSGPLKRIYIDRIIGYAPSGKILKCSGCDEVLGAQVIYEKENRLAIRLFQDSIKKKITTQDAVK